MFKTTESSDCEISSNRGNSSRESEMLIADFCVREPGKLIRVPKTSEIRHSAANQNCRCLANISDDRISRVDSALLVVAKLLEEDDVYLPIFLRLEEEAAAIQAKEAALVRAKRMIS